MKKNTKLMKECIEESKDRITWHVGEKYSACEVSLSMLLMGLLGYDLKKTDYDKIMELESVQNKSDSKFTVMMKPNHYMTINKCEKNGERGDFTIFFSSGKITNIKKKDFDKSKLKK
jgi:hypothetical protein